MDPTKQPSGQNPTQSTGGAAPVNPPPPLEPKVFDLSSINSVNKGNGNSSFKKKPIIIGVLSVLILVAALSIGTYFYFGQPEPERTSPPTQAYSEGPTVSVTCTNLEPGETVTTRMVVHKFNSKAEYDQVKNSQDPNTVPQLVGERPPSGCDRPGNYCVDGSSCTAGNGEACEASATIPDCSLVQLDCMNNTGGTIQFNPNGCSTGSTPTPSPTPAEFSCLYIETMPEGHASTVTPGEVIDFKNSTKGSTGTWQSTWNITSSGGTEVGTIAPLNYNTAKWTVPAAPVSGQTWTVTTTVKDKSGAEDTTGCSMAFSYGSVTTTPTPTPTPTPTVTPSGSPTPTPTPTYRTCENNACVTKPGTGNTSCDRDSDCQKTTHKACVNNACVEVQGAGSDSCTSDASCQPAAVPPPIPESGNTALTLVGIITGLAALGAALFLAL